jgi:hypothetical protein
MYQRVDGLQYDGDPARGRRLNLNPTHRSAQERGDSHVFATCSLEPVPVCFLAGIVAVVDFGDGVLEKEDCSKLC